MTRGSVDLRIVRSRLQILAELVADLRALPSESLEAFLADRRNAPAAESLLRRAIEALFDTARHLLSKAHGLGALEYREVARRSVAHGLIPEGELGAGFVRIAGFRNRLTHHYEEVTAEELLRVLTDHLEDLEDLAEALRTSAARLARDRSPQRE